MSRSIYEEYPDYTSEIRAIKNNGITVDLLYQIIRRHNGNSAYNKRLFERYKVAANGVPIFGREPKFNDKREINNKLNNDFFSEIIDFKTGYFAGTPISYGYSKTDEAEEVTGGGEAVEAATKAVTDFVTRNNMFGTDMEITKYASIYGYAGRLFYIDKDGNLRVMPLHGFETIILSETDICEPEYAIHYYPTTNLDGTVEWTVEFYDEKYIRIYTGTLTSLTLIDEVEHCFDRCPLQAIANNKELMGDGEKVLSLIDGYDKVLSDNSNEVESFVHALMVYKNLKVDDETIEKAQKTGAIVIPPVGASTQNGDVGFITKNINDAFTEHHLERLQANIYRFSKTPNLADQTFGTASGISLKFKLHGLETKCGMFEAKMKDAAYYMWTLLSEAWAKKDIAVDPLQVTMEFSRNFPLDLLSEAQAAQALIAAGLPKEIVYAQLSFIDDPDYVIEMIEKEKEDIPPVPKDNDEADENDGDLEENNNDPDDDDEGGNENDSEK